MGARHWLPALKSLFPTQSILDRKEYSTTQCQQVLFPFFISFLNLTISLFIFFNINFFNWRLLYNIIVVLPYIDMNPPRVYMCSPS